MKRVVVTGATGMIGASLIEQLLEEKIYVTAIIRPDSRKIKNLPKHENLQIVECDLHKLFTLKEKLQKDYDVFYHFAWDGTYGNSRNDILLQERNVYDTLMAVELAHVLNCKVFIGAGSQAEFGLTDQVLSDRIPKNPVHGYGAAKYLAGKLSSFLCRQYGIRQSWGRIVSTYGPYDNEYTMVMSAITGMLNGKRMSFTKGEQIWDYLYASDCARAFYLIGKYGSNGKAYTVASGKSCRLCEYIGIIRDVINPELEIGIGEKDYYPDQVMNLTADIGDLVSDTGFFPKVSFEEGIRKTVKWYKEGNG